jgi:hypothetical protein
MVYTHTCICTFERIIEINSRLSYWDRYEFNIIMIQCFAKDFCLVLARSPEGNISIRKKTCVSQRRSNIYELRF